MNCSTYKQNRHSIHLVLYTFYTFNTIYIVLIQYRKTKSHKKLLSAKVHTTQFRSTFYTDEIQYVSINIKIINPSRRLLLYCCKRVYACTQKADASTLTKDRAISCWLITVPSGCRSMTYYCIDSTNREISTSNYNSHTIQSVPH